MTSKALHFAIVVVALAVVAHAELVEDKACSKAYNDAPSSVTFSDDTCKANATATTCGEKCAKLIEDVDKVCKGKNVKDAYGTTVSPYEQVEVQLLTSMEFSSEGTACKEFLAGEAEKRISNCADAWQYASTQLTLGHYCSKPQSTDSKCHEECQKAVNKVFEHCKAGDVYDTSDNSKYDEFVASLVLGIAGPTSCSYDASAASAAVRESSVAALAVAAAVTIATLFLLR